MYIILLKFTDNRHNAAPHLADHKSWLAQGFDDGVFLMAGTLGSNLGGAILAREGSMATIKERLNKDPFVREKIVDAEVLEFSPSFASEEIRFLLD